MLTSSERSLLRKVWALKASEIRSDVDNRLAEFKSFRIKDEEEWFSELCFCILTANSKARTAMAIQDELGAAGFRSCAERDVCDCIKSHKHRFHNNKARFIVEARRISDLKQSVEDASARGERIAREWLVRAVKGISYKEASHFLRNVGYENVAILDRHILNILAEHRIIRKPKTLTRKRYLYYEGIFFRLSREARMTPVEMDIYLWYMKTGAVLK